MMQRSGWIWMTMVTVVLGLATALPGQQRERTGRWQGQGGRAGAPGEQMRVRLQQRIDELRQRLEQLDRQKGEAADGTEPRRPAPRDDRERGERGPRGQGHQRGGRPQQGRMAAPLRRALARRLLMRHALREHLRDGFPARGGAARGGERRAAHGERGPGHRPPPQRMQEWGPEARAGARLREHPRAGAILERLRGLRAGAPAGREAGRPMQKRRAPGRAGANESLESV